MRTVIRARTSASVAHHLAASPDWEVLQDQGFGREDVLARFADVTERARSTGRSRLPTHVENSLIRQVVDGRPEYRARSFYRAAISNVLVLLSQLPESARHDLDAEIVVAVNQELNVYAALFVRDDGTELTARLRHDDREHLERATDSMVTATAAASTQYLDDARLLEVNGGLIAQGPVVVYRSKAGAWMKAVLTPIPRTLLLFGIVLTVADAAFFMWSGGAHNVWMWLDGFAGRLATAAFGAALIAAAQQASQLRRLLRATAGAGKGATAAYVNWG